MEPQRAPSIFRSAAGSEHDRVGDRDSAAFGLRERKPVERADRPRHDAAVRHVRPAVLHLRHRAIVTDDEAHGDAALEVRAVAQTVLVTEAEATEVLANDTLNDLGRETTADLRSAHANLRRLGPVRATEAAVAGAEALPGAGASAVTDGADRAEADAFAATAAAFADTGEAEAAGAERVADVSAPHVAASAERIVTERLVTTPRRGGRVGIAAGAGVEETDHAELRSVTERRGACDVRIGVVGRSLHAVAVASGLGVGVTHGTLFTLGARAGTALLVVGGVVGDLL